MAQPVIPRVLERPVSGDPHRWQDRAGDAGQGRGNGNADRSRPAERDAGRDAEGIDLGTLNASRRLGRHSPMLHHERLRPPSHDYPADEWNVIEKRFHPEFLAQLETMLALGNGYLGMRGCPEEGGPHAENSTLINGFYETRPIVYAEEAYGFAKTGQTIFSVTDSKIIKLFVDDEPFWLPSANLLSYDRRLNMKSGTLDREILWETPAGKQVLITSRRLISFANRHLAALAYRVTLLNAAASLVISSEMATNEPSARINGDDPRQTKVFSGRVLHQRANYSKDRRIVLCHATEKSRLILTCATD